MKELITFFKDIFLMKDCADQKVGLCQFKSVTPVEKATASVEKPSKEIKLSDLMRRSA